MKKIVFILTLLFTSIIYSQNCKPKKVSKQTNGDTVNLYGGLVSKTGMWESENAEHFLYIAQINNGKKGTSIIAILNQPYKDKKDYIDADYLKENNLKNSTLELELNGEKIVIPTTECKFKPPKHAYSPTYTVVFEGDILKSDIKKLQNYDLQRFRLNIGGLPYERYFKKPNSQTTKLKKSFNCVNMDNVFEIKKKEAGDMDLTEILKKDYSDLIKGKWSLQEVKGKVIEFKKEKVVFSKMGVIENEGSYKIVGNRIIFTTKNGNTISEINMFLKDMIILKEKGKEKTYERLE